MPLRRSWLAEAQLKASAPRRFCYPNLLERLHVEQARFLQIWQTAAVQPLQISQNLAPKAGKDSSGGKPCV